MKKLFSLRNMLLMAMLIAISIILSRFLGFYLDPDSLRISFECSVIILAGVWLGPIAGAVVGGVSDILGCLLSGYGFYPPLTIPPIVIGFLGGLLSKYLFKDKKSIPALVISCFTAEFIGNMLLSTYALMLYTGAPDFISLFIMRLPFKLVILICDTAIVILLNKLLYKKVVERFLSYRGQR